MRNTWPACVAALMAATMLLIGNTLAAPPRQPADGASAAPARQAASASELLFVQNVGQFAPDVRFQVYGAHSTLFVADDALWVTAFAPPPAAAARDQDAPTRQDTPGATVRLRYAGANPRAQIESFAPQSSRVSYYIGNDPTDWHADVPVWSGVRFTNIYPNMDLELSSAGGRLTQRFVLRPGADPRAVRMEVDGAQVALANNALRLDTAAGTFSLPLAELVASDGAALPSLASVPQVRGQSVIAPFRAQRAANAKVLAAPEGASDLIYGALFGGNDYERGGSIAVDQNGAAYIAGFTQSSNFPRTTGENYSGKSDAFVVKVNAAGSVLNYATFLGGKDEDQATGIAVRGNEAYVVGSTESKDFPTKKGASSFDKKYSGEGDAFAVKLNSTGERVYATYLGGKSDDRGFGIAVDQSGAAYVTGATSSNDFPIKNGLDTSVDDRDAFIVKLDSGGDQTYGTFVGGSDYERGDAIAVDQSGAVYLLGTTASANLLTTDSAYDRTTNGGNDLFLTKLNAAGSQQLYATFLGGSGNDQGSPALAVDSSANAYIAGTTGSTDFPTTNGAYDQAYNGGDDAIVATINTNRSGAASLVYGSFLGGTSNDKANGLAVSDNGTIYVSGETSSANFPATPNGYDQSFNGGGRDAFLSRLNPSGAGAADLTYSTFIGGSGDESGGYLALDSNANSYLTGYTNSANFPTTAILNPATSGGSVFAVKLGADASEPPPTPTRLPPTNTPPPPATSKPGEPTATVNTTATAAAATANTQATATSIQETINTAVAQTLVATAVAATAIVEEQTATAVAATIGVEDATSTAAPTETPDLAATADAQATEAALATALAPTPTNTPPPPVNAPQASGLTLYVPIIERPAFVPPTATPLPTATPPPTATPLPVACADVEDNDTSDQARQITPPIFCTGSLQDDPQGEDDYYWIDLAAGQRVQISLSGMPAGSDYDLILYTPRIDEAAISNKSGSVDEFVDYTVQQSGRFFIRINMATKAVTDNVYSLRVTLP